MEYGLALIVVAAVVAVIVAMPVAGWALVVATTWPIVAFREVDFSLVAARTLERRA